MSILGDTWWALEQQGEWVFPWVHLLLDAAVKGSLLLVLAAVACTCLPRSSAAFRHFIWTLASIGFLFCPFFSFVFPPLDLPVLPAKAQLAQTASNGSSIETAIGDVPAVGINVMMIVCVVWLIGAAIYLLCWGIGLARTYRSRQMGAQLSDHSLLNLVQDACGEVGLKRVPQILIADDAIMPMTFGVFKPVVLLPSNCLEWSIERTRVVLLHELSHVRRLDSLVQTLFQFLFVFHWYHPLLWYAGRQMRLLREEACDDRVIGCGVSPVDYSRHLVEMVREFRLLPAAQMAGSMMARASQLETRVRDLLTFVRNREAIPIVKILVVSCLAVLIVGPVAVIRPVPRANSLQNAMVPSVDLPVGDMVVSSAESIPVATTTRRRIVLPAKILSFSIDDLKLENILNTGETTVAQIVSKGRNQTYFLSSGQSQDGIQVESVDQSDRSVILIQGSQKFRLQLVDDQFDPTSDINIPELKSAGPTRRRMLGA
jgi:beta-lactamase regulating signal transducer with metallopeptidase domain